MGWLGMVVQDEFPYRIIGAAVLAFTASSWYSYQAAEWERVKIVILAEIAWTVLNVLVGLFGLIFSGLPTTEWINADHYGRLWSPFIYFYSKENVR